MLPVLFLTERQEPLWHSSLLSLPCHTFKCWFGINSGLWHTGHCSVLSLEAARSDFRKFIWVMCADSEVWEWDKENGEELDLLVFNVSLRKGVGSCYIQSRQLVQTLSK